MFDDVIDDVGGGVEDAAGFLDFGFVFDDGMVAGGQTDDLAEELFIDLAEDVGRQDGKFVGAVGVVEVAEDVFERFVVDEQAGGQAVGEVGLVFFCTEVEQSGVVTLVGALKELDQVGVNVRGFGDLAQLFGRLDAAIFGDAQEDDPVDGHLDGVVQLALVELRVAQGDIARQQFAPAFDFRQEGIIDFGSAALAGNGFGVTVEGALQDGVARKNGGELIPFIQVLLEGQHHQAAGGGLVGAIGFGAAVEDGELFEVGQDRERQLGRPGVAAQLEGRADVVFDVDRRFLGFDEEFTRTADAKAIVRGACVDR